MHLFSMLAGIIIGAVPAGLLVLVYCIHSGYGPGWRRGAEVTEQARAAHGAEIRRRGVRRRARDLVEVENEAEHIRAGR